MRRALASPGAPWPRCARAAAGCGEADRGPRARPRRARRAAGARDASRRGDRPGAGRACEIAVVTHGQASSAFWTIVRNGVDAAAAPDRRHRQLPLARRLQRRPHAPADRRGGGQRGPTGSSSRSPREALAPSIRARGQRRHPGRLDQLRQRRLRSGSARSPTSASRRTARGFAAGERLAAPGVRRGALRQPRGRQRGPRPALRAGSPGRCARRRARARAGDRHQGPEEIAAAARAERSPTARSTGCSRSTTPAARSRSRSRPASVLLAHVRHDARRSSRPCAAAGCCSRSTSSPTSRATCRSCSWPSASATGSSRRRATSSPPARTS